MIRPFTGLCVLMAAGSGLYLYQTKHRSQLLDRDIVRLVNETQQARERTQILKAEYAQLNQPDRLQELVTKFLDLKPTQPQQFVQLADLDSRLPPPRLAHGPAMDQDDAADAPVAMAPIAPPPAPPPAAAQPARAPSPPVTPPIAAAPPPAPGPSHIALADAHPAAAPPPARVPPPNNAASAFTIVSTPRSAPAAAPERPSLEKASLEKASLERPSLEKASLERPSLEKASAEKTAVEKDKPAPERAERPAVEHQAGERAVAELPRRSVTPEAPRPTPRNETPRNEAAQSSPPPRLGAQIYQTSAPMPPRPSLTAMQSYAAYGATSALGSFRTPLAPPVPVAGPTR
jgi:hypothetical protein